MAQQLLSTGAGVDALLDVFEPMHDLKRSPFFSR